MVKRLTVPSELNVIGEWAAYALHWHRRRYPKNKPMSEKIRITV
jgi:hypothetical protein